MKICIIGTGYVGLVAGTCFAETGNDVICVDNEKHKLEKLSKGIIPIYEPNLEELIKTNVSKNRLSFTDNINSAIKDASICFITVGTPQGDDGQADLKYIKQVSKEIAKAIKKYTIIVVKSTVPVGSAEVIEKIIKKETNVEFDIISNPEFLKQGSAIEDFLKPDRIIIGSNSKKATEIIKDLYSPFVRTGNPIITMDIKSAEMTKYAANTFLAVKISFANEIANICEKTGADIEMVRKGISSDKRIGSQFLFAGLGYGGSCFPKDIKALIKTSEDNNYESKLLKAADEINKSQKTLFIEKILKEFNYDIKNKTFAIWGLAFKPKTNDLREAPSLYIINTLLDKGAKIKAYDPKAMEKAKEYFNNKIELSKTSYDALKNCDALILITEWNEFRHPDFNKIKKLLKTPIIFDGRNQYSEQILKKEGFKYVSVGKNNDC